MNKRQSLKQLGAIALGLASALTLPTAGAAEFPSRPITLIVPYGAGGPTDQHVRVMAEEASQILGQPITIENRAGANGTNGASAMARAEPDGYTLAIVPSSIYREPHINKVSYDAANSFSYIMLMTSYTFGFAVKNDAPWKTWAEFAADAAKRPNEINVGATGAIGTPRIGVEEAADSAGIKVNVIPYKGDADVATAILGGHIDAAPISGVAVPYIEAGKMRYLAMMTDQRIKRFPDLPTLKELGVKASIDTGYGIVGPAGMDASRVKVIHDAFKKALESKRSLEVMDRLNQQPTYKGPKDYREYALQNIALEKVRVAKLRERGILK